MTTTNIARRVSVFPEAPERYDILNESEFRRALEQQIQQLYAIIADLAKQVEDLTP